MKKTIFSILAIATLLLTGCDPDDGGDKKREPGPVWSGSNLSGDLNTKTTLNPTVVYTLTAPLYVHQGGELTIPAGTVIKANKGDNFILVEMGGKIFVEGTAAAPVVMTSAESSPAAADWGGLIINGRAPLAGGQTNVDTEIDSSVKYGGTNQNDNSGVIRYLVLAYTGYASSATVEHNGLTLNGVGRGTTIENVFVPFGGDDGIEFFGSFCNVDKLLVVNSDDDMFDFTRGYNGTLSNAYGVWLSGFSSGESDPSGVEADGNFDGDYSSHTNQSDFTIQNVTFDLRQGTTDNLQNVLRIRRGAKANIVNALATGNGTVDNVVNLDDGKGGAALATTISLTNDLSGTVGTEYKAPTTTTFGDFASKTAADYIEAGNTGCSKSHFGWITNAGSWGFTL